MVYRGFLADTDKLTFVTDHRTEKLEEFGHQSWAEVQLQCRFMHACSTALCQG